MEKAKTQFLEVLEAIANYNLKNVLYNGQELTGSLDTWERFEYGAFLAAAVAESVHRDPSVAPRFAYVLKEPVLDPERFAETVAVNRGVHGKAFDNLKDAFEWLGIASANEAT